MPKKFIAFLIVTQGLLTFLNWLLYKLLLFFYPALLSHSGALLTAILLLSVSFLIFSLLVHYFTNFLIDFGYMVAAVFLVFNLYLLIGLSIAGIIYLVLPPTSLWIGHIAVAFVVVLTAYGLINARILRVTNIQIKLPNLPKFWKNKTAVVAADIHLGNILRNGFAQKVITRINGLNPDIVFLPGDFYDGGKTEYAKLANELKNIKSHLGTYYVSGNHELYAGYYECEEAIKNTGVKILEDEKVEVEGLQILGLAYREETGESVWERLNKMSIDKNKASILLKHVPNHFTTIEKAGVNFQLSGHSHQGQIWPGRYITKKVWKGYDYGFKKFGNLQIFTSSGVGTWGPPLRVFTKSEIVKITFI